MTEFRKAPDGQPTDNILLQLSNAKDEEREWRVAVHHHTIRLEGAQKMQASEAERVAELEWQLAQRLAEGLESPK